MDIQYIKNTNLAYCDGYKFRKDKNTGYWLCTTLKKRLHRYIYEKYNGPIPKGYEIHHIDMNKDNNEIDNLQMVTRKEHNKIHEKLLTNERRKQLRENLNKNARPKAIEWHKSKEGKEWHKEHYEDTLGKYRQNNMQKFICANCGKEYQAIANGKNKFCSNNCKSQWRRKNHLDDIVKICPICNKEFTTNKYSKVTTCSRKCAIEYKKQLQKFNLEEKR